MSNDNSEFIDKFDIESEILQESFPKGCLMSAEDIALATSPAEIDFFSNLDTANRILTALIEHETKLQRAFEKDAKDSSFKNVAMARNQSLVGISDFVNPSTPMPSASLPSIESSVMFSQSVHVDTHFENIFEFDHKKLILAGFHLLPPLVNTPEFNGAIYKLSLFANAVQNIFNVSPEVQIIPAPSAAILQHQNERGKLYFLQKKSQIQDIQALQITMEAFIRLCIAFTTTASNVLKIKPFALKYEDMNITSMLSLPTIANEWNQAAVGVIKLAKYLVDVIDLASKTQINEDGSYSEPLITNEDGSVFKL